MGYTEFDIALLNAWHRAQAKFKDDPERLERVIRRFSGPTYTRPLRSWSLVLRANDKRLPDDNAQGIVRMDRARVLRWCSPVAIRYPGVSLDDAATRFGVNRTTVARWASPAERSWRQEVQRQMDAAGVDPRLGRPGVYEVTGRRLMLEYEYNRANPRRSCVRVWTPGYEGVDPGGEVWSGPWGVLRLGLAERVSADFVQQLERVDRRLGEAWSAGPAARVMQWVCPAGDGGCGRLVYKLYLPMPRWSLLAALGGVSMQGEAGELAFVCQRCAGLLYESAGREASPGRRVGGSRRGVDVWDRFMKRLSAGVLSGGAVGRSVLG